MIVAFDVCEKYCNDHLFVEHFVVAYLAVPAVSLARMVIVNGEHRSEDLLVFQYCISEINSMDCN